jgi:hypothetical protein
MQKFSPKDCPKDQTVFQWISSQIDYEEAKQSAPPKQKYPDILSFEIKNWDLQKMTICLDEIIEKYGDHSWANNDGRADNIKNFYTGFSLVYNPNHQEGLDPHASTLGTKKNSTSEEMYWAGTQNHDFIKDSYYDTYGFNNPTPASQYGYLGDFMERCKRSRVRSRVGIIHGDKPASDSFGWHKDEEIWENLRINIPITTTESMKFQFEDKPPVHLDAGWAYSFDSNVPHRVFSTEVSDCCRIHLVLGVSPWFDYDPVEDIWITNEFYGKKHPFDMLVDGDILDGLKFDPEKQLKKSKLLFKYRNPFSERFKNQTTSTSVP